MMNKAMTNKQVLAAIKGSNAARVKLAITDIDGVLRGKYIHKDKFESALDGGLGFCDVVFGWDSNDTCYDNVKYTGWHTGYPDAHARIDPNTFRRVPWDSDVPFFLADFYDAANQPLNVCPRQLLKTIIARALDAGFTSKFALEFEFFNFRETPKSLADKRYLAPETLTPGMFGYSLTRMGSNRDYVNALLNETEAFGIPIEGLHTETGPGVYEAAILYSDPLEAADRAVLFKASAKEIGARFGIMPSFMAKWNNKLPGCSGHVHQSLWHKDSETNVFHDAHDDFGMSSTFKSYLAGQMLCLPEILPFFAPTINSYKRLVEGMWAPTRVTWARDNRTTAFRVIQGSAKSTRLETRVSGSDVNGYLAVAAALASGLYGIANNLKLQDPPISGSGYNSTAVRLPRNLHEATERMANSTIARELFGAPFVEHFAATREWEWRQFHSAVTDWEMQRYFEII